MQRRARARLQSHAVALLGLLGSGPGCGDDVALTHERDAARPRMHGAQDAATRDAAPPARDAMTVDEAGMHDADAPTDAALDPDAGNAFLPIVGDDYVDFGELVPERNVLRVELDVAQDAFSLVVTADPGLAPRRLALLELRGPSGAVLYDGSASEPQPFEPVSSENASEYLPYSWMLPSSPELLLEPGRYRIAFYAGASSVDGATVHVDAVLARGDAAAPPHALALTVWSAPSAALDAAAAASDPSLTRALARMGELYAAAGIALAPVEYRDLDADLDGDGQPEGNGALAMLDGDDELALVLALIALRAGPERALDLVLVDELAVSPGKTVLAKVSSVPIAPAHPALARRGAVIIPLASLPPNAERAGALLAHECAHALGLAHTSDPDGASHDPIADTPECPAERASHHASDGSAALSAEDCQDLDGTNLLFYTPPMSALSQDQLTPGQAFVLSRNPLLR